MLLDQNMKENAQIIQRTSFFGFDGIKNITSGEGGCVVTSNKKVDEYIKNSEI